MPFEKGKSGNPDTTFKPGESGNPLGYPKGVPNRSTQLRKWVDLVVQDVRHPTTGELMPGTVEDQIDVAQVALAIAGNTNAYNAIKEELYGKRMQKTEITGGNGGPIQHSHTITPEDVEAFKAEFNTKY